MASHKRPWRRHDPDGTSSFLIGLAAGISLYGALPFERLWLEESRPPAIVVTMPVVVALALGLWSVRSRSLLGLALLAAAAPLLVSTGASGFVGREPAWIDALRTGGTVLLMAVALAAALVYARRQRELERLVFSEATSVAFFITIIATAAYGAVQSVYEVPPLSFAWLPPFATTTWMACVLILERRYA